ncbi:MAG TPA: iron-regulated protein [Bacteroidales bacterium]|nr:iron-regulated protein [Bacteroidales bacterium]
MKKILLSFVFATLLFSAQAQHLAAYQLFDSQGNKADFGQMVSKALENQVILFGELHNNAIAHWLKLELSKALHEAKGEDFIMGAEMFEADNQLILNEYLGGLITERNFRAEAKLWRNYETDIRPLVELARTQKIPFIATNIPRRYAAIVNQRGFEGLDALSKEAKEYIAPLPIAYDPELPGYKAMLEMRGMPGHTGVNFPKAQAIKDATMAYFIEKALKQNSVFLHFNGAFHSNNYEGIVWYLQRLNSRMRIMTISTVEQEDVSSLKEEHLGLADFIIVVPTTMTKTH